MPVAVRSRSPFPVVTRSVRPLGPGVPVTRRGLLAALALGAAVGTTAGCGLVGADPAVPPAPADPLEDLLRAKQALIDRYVATLAAHPGLEPRLGPLRDAHRTHLLALLNHLDARRRLALSRGTPPIPASPDRTDDTGGPTPGDPPTSTTPVSDEVDVALAELRTAERNATRQSRAACLAAEDGARAVLLGSVAAAEASHLVVLE